MCRLRDVTPNASAEQQSLSRRYGRPIASFSARQTRWRRERIAGNLCVVTDRLKSLPLPDDPNLAAWASALNDAGHWAHMYDASWRLVFATDELRLTFGDTGAVTVLPIGFHLFSAEATRFRVSVNRGRFVLPEFRRAHFLEIGPYVLASTPGGREELRRVVDPEFADLVDQLEPKDPPAVWPRPGAVRHGLRG